MSQLLVATGNAGKIKEFEKLLADLPVHLCGLDVFPPISEPEETGATFAENAALKARFYSQQTGLPSLADDSGLEVESLNNAPGIFSARYAGKNADDAAKIEKLLKELSKNKDQERRARFVCAIAFSNKEGEIKFVAEGVCAGKIAFERRGANGFGYDPIFIPDNFSETFGELPSEIKQTISHRAQASRKIIQYLHGICAASS